MRAKSSLLIMSLLTVIATAVSCFFFLELLHKFNIHEFYISYPIVIASIIFPLFIMTQIFLTNKRVVKELAHDDQSNREALSNDISLLDDLEQTSATDTTVVSVEKRRNRFFHTIDISWPWLVIIVSSLGVVFLTIAYFFQVAIRYENNGGKTYVKFILKTYLVLLLFAALVFTVLFAIHTQEPGIQTLNQLIHFIMSQSKLEPR